uniref:Uncharacterized protein n=1 Tax=Rhodosorus marinus TaxID=101924 RepID=A0A7S2ZKI1_9RHOD|mmetsp:Transcript_2279/g.9569  ORF Transcript_2279/g.9569 Transcript_2279/m.9569 type:complete len:244 (+) Transcript_2279:588-1319(+)
MSTPGGLDASRITEEVQVRQSGNHISETETEPDVDSAQEPEWRPSFRRHGLLLIAGGAGLIGLGAAFGVPLGSAIGKEGEASGSISKKKSKKSKNKKVGHIKSKAVLRREASHLALRALGIATVINACVAVAASCSFVYYNDIQSPEEVPKVVGEWTRRWFVRVQTPIQGAVARVESFGKVVGESIAAKFSSFGESKLGRWIHINIESSAERRRQLDLELEAEIARKQAAASSRSRSAAEVPK